MQKYLMQGVLALLLLCARQVQGAASSSGNSLTEYLRQIGRLQLTKDINNTSDLTNVSHGILGLAVIIPNYAGQFDFADWSLDHTNGQFRSIKQQPKPELPRMGSLPSLPVSSGVPAELRRIGAELMVTENIVRDSNIISDAEKLQKLAEGYGQQRGDLDRSLWALGQFQSITNYEAQFRGVVRPRTPYSRPIKLRDALRGRDELSSMPGQSSPARDDFSSIPSPSPTPTPITFPRPTQPTPPPLSQQSSSPVLPPSSSIPSPSPAPSPIRLPGIGSSSDIPAPRIPSPTFAAFAPVQERDDIVEYRTNKSELQDICDDYTVIGMIAQAIQNEYPAARGMQNLTEIVVAETGYFLCGDAISTRYMTFDELKDASLERLKGVYESLFTDGASCAQAVEIQFGNTLGGSKHSEAFSVLTTRRRLPAIRSMLRRMEDNLTPAQRSFAPRS